MEIPDSHATAVFEIGCSGADISGGTKVQRGKGLVVTIPLSLAPLAYARLSDQTSRWFQERYVGKKRSMSKCRRLVHRVEDKRCFDRRWPSGTVSLGGSDGLPV